MCTRARSTTIEIDTLCACATSNSKLAVIMAPSFFYLALFGLCVSLVRDWEKDKDATPSSLGVKYILHSQLRRSRLWQRVREGEGRRSSDSSRGGGKRRKGRPAWLVVGLLLLSGDVELNPGPETRRGGSEDGVEVPTPERTQLEESGN